MVVDAIIDRAARGRANVAGDPSAAEPRREEVAVEEARATGVKRCLGQAGVDEGGRRRRDVERSRSCDLDDQAARPDMPSSRQSSAGGNDELGPVSMRAVES
jgi:hypothetical protein